MVEGVINLFSSEDMLKAVIAKNLKALRQHCGLSQQKLALHTGLNRVTIARYETGKQLISLINLLAIAHALTVTPNDLLEGWDNL